MRSILPLLCSILIFTQAPNSIAQPSYDIHGIDENLFTSLNIDLQQPLSVVVQHMVHGLEQKGYFLATVMVKPEGVIAVDLGSINLIRINGFSEKVEKRIRGYLTEAMKTQQTMNNYDHALALINDMPGVAASMAFELDKEKGGYAVIISGQEGWQFGSVSVDSTPRNLFQQNRISLQQNFYNTVTGGDVVRFQGGFVSGDGKPDQTSLYLDYEFPVGNSGLFAEFSVGDVSSETAITAPTSQSFSTSTGFTFTPGGTTRHDFEGQFASLVMGYPLAHQHDGATYILANVDITRDETQGIGKTDISFAEVSAFQTYYSPDGWSYVVSVTVGGGDVDSYIDAYDGTFSRAQFHLGYIQPVKLIAAETELRLETSVQLGSSDTPNALLLALGDEQFLRGYESSTFSGANGMVSSAELAHSFKVNKSLVRHVTSFVFLDAGFVSNSDEWVSPRRPKKDNLVSTGVGASAGLTNNVSLYGYLGIPLLKDYSGATPSPRGYLRLGWSW